jgi:hypothetical protein
MSHCPGLACSWVHSTYSPAGAAEAAEAAVGGQRVVPGAGAAVGDAGPRGRRTAAGLAGRRAVAVRAVVSRLLATCKQTAWNLQVVWKRRHQGASGRP